MSYEDQVMKFVREHSIDGEHNVLVDKLSEFLNDAAIAKVLYIIQNTCNHCWDTDTTHSICFCSRDD